MWDWVEKSLMHCVFFCRMNFYPCAFGFIGLFYGGVILRAAKYHWHPLVRVNRSARNSSWQYPVIKLLPFIPAVNLFLFSVGVCNVIWYIHGRSFNISGFIVSRYMLYQTEQQTFIFAWYLVKPLHSLQLYTVSTVTLSHANHSVE